MNTLKNYIGGAWRAPSGDTTIEDRNPARTSDLIGTFQASGAEDVEAAVAAAAAAFPSWRATPAPHRGDLLRRIGDLLTERKDDIAFEMTREMGKPFTETRGDVQEAIDTAYYAASETRRLFGHTVPSELPDKFNMTIRRPLGVCGIITAWNFPVAVPTWKMFPALAAGNTVVFKPSEDAPHSGQLLVQVFIDAGLPDGVANLLQGDGSTGAALVSHPGVQAVSFTGSTETGARIAETCGRLHKRCSLEMGGKNPQIVMEDADLDLAVEGVLWGAFGTTGQRCTATSRLILHEAVHDEMVRRVKAQAEQLVLGYGNDDGVEVGPLINRQALDKVSSYVQIGRDEGARLVLGGDRAEGPGLDEGFFFEPTIFTDVTPDMRIAREEIFGPVLAVIPYEDEADAVRIANDSDYGLSGTVWTQDVTRGVEVARRVRTGTYTVNGFSMAFQAPFGGFKASGLGRELGPEGLHAYLESKTINLPPGTELTPEA